MMTGCGCCGRWVDGSTWCSDCLVHLGPDDRPTWERTYYAQHHAECPYQVPRFHVS